MSKFKNSTEKFPDAGVRERLGAPFRAVRFDGSPHVGHLRYHRHQYTQVCAVHYPTVRRCEIWTPTQLS